MRLAILTQYYPPEIGAPQARLSGLARLLSASGHEVVVLTAMPNYPTGKIHPGYGGLFRRERLDGVTVVRSAIYPTQSASMVRRLANYFSFVASSFFAGLRTGSFDYLMVESPPLFLGITGILLARLKGARLIFNVSDLWPDSAARLGLISRSGLAFRLSAALEKLCYRSAWLVTGQTAGIVATIAERFPGTPLYHLSNGVDTSVFSPERATGAARAALGAPGERCVAVYAGLHGLAQGLDQVVQALSILASRGLGGDPGLDVVFIGDGPQKASLMESVPPAIARFIRFLPPRPNAEIPALLAAADVILVPLRGNFRDAAPSKLYEAFASGRAVMAVSDGEAAEMVHRVGGGLSVDPGDVDALAGALARLRDEPALRAELGTGGRRGAESLYDRRALVGAFAAEIARRSPPKQQ
ncbi:MAG: hypothetical protein JWO05_1309 [Gemmatimonadetes bacterium]|nr:hypothetical protein [Gemmatimonadota bacterium]